MILYVDTSVALRVVLRHPKSLVEWPRADRTVASTLLEVEALRALDRWRHDGSLDEDALAAARDAIYEMLLAAELVELDAAILRRAAMPFPTQLGTLDAIHLTSALEWTESTGEALTLGTHDLQLARAARAVGLEVLGV